MTRREREQRAREALEALRRAWLASRPVELVLQNGRRRPRVTGRVVYVAVSGAYALLADGGVADESIGERPGPLHVPIDAVRVVGFKRYRGEGFRRVVPNPSPVPGREDPR